MIKSALYLAPDSKSFVDLDKEKIGEAFRRKEGLLWVDIEDADDDDGHFLGESFNFHPLMIADCLSKNIHPPKIDDFEDYLFMIIHGINYFVESDIEETIELGIFVGTNYVVTSHDTPMRSIDSILERIKIASGRAIRQRADMFAQDIIDAVVDNILPTIDELSDKLNTIETEVLQNPEKETLGKIMQLKKSIMAINRVMTPQRELVGNLSRGFYPIISEMAQLYYRNIYDHMVRIETLTQDLRDLADSVLATYLSSVSNRMNEVMKVLSIVAAIFLPLALVAGIYGMNFINMPELEWRYGYFVILGIMGGIAAGLAVYFKRRRWF